MAGVAGAAGAGGFVVGLSGGVDSAVAAALSARAVGAGSVLALYLPCQSPEDDRRDAALVASSLGIGLKVIPLDSVFDCMVRTCDLSGAPKLTLANIKPRLRMSVLYAFSQGRLVVGTGNYSEYLVGYSTKWGDSAADLMPLARLYKDEVRALGRALGLPPGIVDRTPSAGLWAGQSDEEEMGVTYSDIRVFFEGGPLPEETSSRIRRMCDLSGHKREPIPFFDAREWMSDA